MSGSDDLLTRVKENLKVFGGSDTTDKNVQDVISDVRQAGQKVLLQNPRRGIHHEYKHFLHNIIKPELTKEATAAGIPFEAPVYPAEGAISDLARAEQWREVEYLTVRPPTFAALKQLPELRQLIAATAVDVIQAASQSNSQVTVLQELYSQAVNVPDPRASSSLQRVVRGPVRSVRRSSYNANCQDGSLSLSLQLSPHLRLALAAEVAAGMLCPEQAAPLDTPEHGNALKMFVQTGYVALTKELKDHTALAKAASSSSSSTRRKPKRTQLQKLWAHTAGTPQQQQRDAACGAGSSTLSSLSATFAVAAAAGASGASVLLPPPSNIRHWALTPHIDLQLQLPPHLLLSYAVLAAVGVMKQVQLDHSAAAGQQQQAPSNIEECDRLWRQLNQQVQCQGFDDEALKTVALLLHKDVLDSLSVTLRGYEVQARIGSSNSSSSNSCTVDGRENGVLEPAALSAAPRAAAAAAAEAEAVAAATAARATAEGRLPQALAETVIQLALRGLLQLLAVGDQQQVPVQALQLLAAVRQLELTAQDVYNTATPHPPAAEASDAQDSAAVPATHGLPLDLAAQQQLVQQSLQLLQHVKAIEAQSAATCTAETIAAAGAASCQTGAANAWESSSTSRSSGSSAVLSPSQFFSADGPLSAFWGFQEPAELPGLWQAAPGPGIHGPAVNGVTAAAEGAPEAGCSSRQTGSGSSGSSSSQQPPESQPVVMGHKLRGMSQQQQQQVRQVLEVLCASALSCTVQQGASTMLEELLGSHQLSYMFDEISTMTWVTCEVPQQLTGPEFKRCERMLQHAIGHPAALEGSKALLRSWCLHEPLVSLVAHARSAICSLLGLPAYDAVAWQRLVSVGRRFDDERLHKNRQGGSSAKGRAGSTQQSGNGNSSDSSDPDSDYAEDFDSNTSAAAAGGGGSRASQGGSSWSNSGNSSSSSSGLGKGHWQSVIADSLTRQHVQRMLSGHQLSSEERAEQARRRDSIVQAAGALRDMAGSVAAQLLPLQEWHQQHIQRQQQAAVKAQKWWDSTERKAAAVAAATGRAKRKQGSAAVAVTTAAAAGDRGEEGGLQADTDSSSAELWPNGLHDSNPQCPLCQTELKQQQRPAGDSSSSSSSIESVPYDDLFLWRRLLWRLLGKLSPEAQAFYAHYLNMCPHSCSKVNWHLVVGSLKRCLWAGGVDVIDKVLATPEGLVSGNRTRLLRQYSRVISTAHCKSYHPSTVLLSKQVLLALSPLHHQVLPPPEVAHLLPSSFMPAVGKGLMQQLFQVSVMDGFQHQHCSLQLWHVWWHVGLRRYRWVQQLQQQATALRMGAHHQPSCNATTISSGKSSSSSSSSGSSGSGRVCGWSTDELYLDADARLYAVGFATRQLTGTSKLPGDRPGGLKLANSSAHTAARQLLHNTAASMVITAILAGRTSQSRPTPGTNPKLATLVSDAVSELYVLPGVLPEGEPLLRLAVTGPADPLVPLQQQRELLHVRCVDPDEGGRRCNQKANARMLYEKVYARHFVRLGCPGQWERDLGPQLQQQQQDSSDSDSQDSSEQQQEDSISHQQQQKQQQQQQGSEDEQQQRWQRKWEREQRRRRGAVVKLSDDTSQLMLLDPVPAECLLGPEVWRLWHEELAGLNSCDICGKEVDPEACWCCGTCSGALYCSKTCGDDDEQHGMICDKLLSARRRYTATPKPDAISRTSSSSACGSLSSHQQQQQQQQQQPMQGLPRMPGLPIITGLLQPPQHEPGPLGQAAAAADNWPDMFGQLDDIIEGLARSSTTVLTT